ncbi:hypothetical protein BO79DRAFT_273957 [Aspergillus costaricaensis CBS 115574]|uniref:Uncharacterized protein n=1 Tax=Aspergillus costaricaensis CBS 115574 TaxID=1448317 RepID=A0ACD1I522_9EURO|nr:hypothetical protein BO79DRAFT_273957 [Aspergillus costaricaensis CBS 115574]RAK85155.1 hypothetical protein BO79DRAFT_273957 [Aspergillus costaricaensis CBS 115574]
MIASRTHPATIGPRACRSQRAMELSWSRQWAVTRPLHLSSQGHADPNPRVPRRSRRLLFRPALATLASCCCFPAIDSTTQ